MLSERDRLLYARHLLLAEIGEAGQKRLCASSVAVPADADARASRIALEYLRRGGVRVAGSDDAGASALPVHDRDGVAHLAGDAALADAAAVLAGAFAAVEAIKAIVGAGRPAALPSELVLAEEPQ